MAGFPSESVPDMHRKTRSSIAEGGRSRTAIFGPASSDSPLGFSARGASSPWASWGSKPTSGAPCMRTAFALFRASPEALRRGWRGEFYKNTQLAPFSAWVVGPEAGFSPTWWNRIRRVDREVDRSRGIRALRGWPASHRNRCPAWTGIHKWLLLEDPGLPSPSSALARGLSVVWVIGRSQGIEIDPRRRCLEALRPSRIDDLHLGTSGRHL